MAEERVQRRLAAILAADMVGYSRLMEADEGGTIARHKAHRNELIDPEIAAHNGRIVKTTGDGLLVEFASVVDATECAVQIQRGMAEREADSPEERRIQYRIGVNLGDIVIEGDDILGGGVNVAARLEGLAEVGGICISDDVFRQIEGKLDLAFDDLGEQKVKNIKKPVKAYAVRLDRGKQGTGSAAPSITPALELPDLPSIAVLPFENMSGDAEQEYFSDGITENIITALSKIRVFFVIARNSSFTYKGKPVKVQQVAKELGVRYVLEGSVQRAGNRVRVTSQLIDATTGGHVWAETYDRELEGIFAMQDDITLSVVHSLRTRINSAEAERALRKRTTDLTAWDMFMRAYHRLFQFDAEGLAECRRLGAQLLERDPANAAAHAMLANALFHEAILGFSDDRAESFSAAFASAGEAVRLDGADDVAHWIKGMIHLYWRREHDLAIAEFERSLELNPNFAHAYGLLGTALAFAGRPDDGIPHIRRALRADPLDPAIFFRFNNMALAELVARRYEAAAEWAEKSILRQPDQPIPRQYLAACYAHLDRLDDARAHLDALFRLQPGAAISNVYQPPFKDPADLEHFLDGLRAAGLPE